MNVSPVALSTLPVGAQARVDRIGRAHPLRRRLLELGFVRGALVRVGEVVIDLRPDGFVFDPNPPACNYNAFVASASSC